MRSLRQNLFKCKIELLMTKTEIKNLLLDLLKGEVDIDYALHKLNKDNLASNDAKPNVSRPLCPTCKKDTLITLSGVLHCMVDGCNGVKGHNVG